MLTLLTFGTLSLKNGDQLTTGAGTQRSRLAILAVLAAAGPRGVTRDRLLGYFWADADEERARQALKQASYALRQAVGVDLFLSNGATLALNASLITSDVAEFEAASTAGEFERAVTLYTGAFLDGVYIKNAGAFENWADSERSRLAGIFEGALGHLAKAAERAERWEEAVRWRRRLAEHDPLSSRAAVALMRTLADAGDVPAAVRHARIYDALVAQELQGGPDPAVAELTAQLRVPSARRPDVVLQPSATTISALPPESAPTHQPLDGRPVPRQRARRLTIAWAVPAVGALLFVAAFARSRRTPPPLPGVVAVTAFANVTGDSTLSSLGVTIADRMGDDLTRSGIPGLRLAGKDAAAIVVSGRIYRQGERIALHARVADARSDRPMIALEPIVAPRSAPERLFEGARERILGALAVLVDSGVARPLHLLSRPPSLGAYREYAAGCEERDNGKMSAAADHFERAFAIDTGFAPALFMAAISINSQGLFERSSRIFRKLESVRDRLSAQDRLGLSYYMARNRGDGQGALRFIRLASASAPGSYWSKLHAQVALEMHHPAEALRVASLMTKRGSEQSVRGIVIGAHHRLGNHRAEYDLAREMSSDTRDGFVALGISAAGAGDTAKVSELVREILALPGQVNWKVVALRSLGAELKVHGHPLDARRVLEEAAVIYEAATDTGAYGNLGELDYARTLEGLGRIEEAARHYRTLAGLAIPASAVGQGLLAYRIKTNALGHLGALEARRGNRDRAEQQLRVLQRLESQYPVRDVAGARSVLGEHRFQEAVILSALSRRAEALTRLHQAFDAGYRHPWLDAHRGFLPEMVGFPPFEAFMKASQ